MTAIDPNREKFIKALGEYGESKDKKRWLSKSPRVALHKALQHALPDEKKTRAIFRAPPLRNTVKLMRTALDTKIKEIIDCGGLTPDEIQKITAAVNKLNEKINVRSTKKTTINTLEWSPSQLKPETQEPKQPAPQPEEKKPAQWSKLKPTEGQEAKKNGEFGFGIPLKKIAQSAVNAAIMASPEKEKLMDTKQKRRIREAVNVQARKMTCWDEKKTENALASLLEQRAKEQRLPIEEEIRSLQTQLTKDEDELKAHKETLSILKQGSKELNSIPKGAVSPRVTEHISPPNVQKEFQTLADTRKTLIDELAKLDKIEGKKSVLLQQKSELAAKISPPGASELGGAVKSGITQFAKKMGYDPFGIASIEEEIKEIDKQIEECDSKLVGLRDKETDLTATEEGMRKILNQAEKDLTPKIIELEQTIQKTTGTIQGRETELAVIDEESKKPLKAKETIEKEFLRLYAENEIKKSLASPAPPLSPEELSIPTKEPSPPAEPSVTTEDPIITLTAELNTRIYDSPERILDFLPVMLAPLVEQQERAQFMEDIKIIFRKGSSTQEFFVGAEDTALITAGLNELLLTCGTGDTPLERLTSGAKEKFSNIGEQIDALAKEEDFAFVTDRTRAKEFIEQNPKYTSNIDKALRLVIVDFLQGTLQAQKSSKTAGILRRIPAQIARWLWVYQKYLPATGIFGALKKASAPAFSQLLIGSLTKGLSTDEVEARTRVLPRFIKILFEMPTVPDFLAHFNSCVNGKEDITTFAKQHFLPFLKNLIPPLQTFFAQCDDAEIEQVLNALRGTT